MNLPLFWKWLIEQNQNVYSILGLIVSVAGFGLAWWTLRKGNVNSSAALSLTISETYATAWDNFLAAIDPKREKYELGELLNKLESGATLFHEGVFVGRVKTLQEKAIKNAVKLLSDDLQTRTNARDLMDQETTFKELRKFCDKRSLKLFRH